MRYYRRPKTTQERKASENCEIKVRAKRNKTNLVDSYDDIQVHRDKCWKSLRKTKYKKVKKIGDWRLEIGGWNGRPK